MEIDLQKNTFCKGLIFLGYILVCNVKNHTFIFESVLLIITNS